MILRFLILFHLKKSFSKKLLIPTIFKLLLVGFIFLFGVVVPLFVKLNAHYFNHENQFKLIYLNSIVFLFPLTISIFLFNAPESDYTSRIFPISDTKKFLNKFVLFILSWPGLSSLSFFLGINMGLFDYDASLRIEILLGLTLGAQLVQAIKQALNYRFKLLKQESFLLILYFSTALLFIFWPFQSYWLRMMLKTLILITSSAALIFIEHVSFTCKSRLSLHFKNFKFFWPLRTISNEKIFPFYLGNFLAKIAGLAVLVLIGTIPFDKINGSIYIMLLLPIYSSSMTIDLWAYFGRFWLLCETNSNNPPKILRRIFLNVVLLNFGFDLGIAFLWALLSHNLHFNYVVFYIVNILVTTLLGYPLSLLSVKPPDIDFHLFGFTSIVLCNLVTVILLFTITTIWFWILSGILLFMASILFFSVTFWFRKIKFNIYLNLLRSNS